MLLHSPFFFGNFPFVWGKKAFLSFGGKKAFLSYGEAKIRIFACETQKKGCRGEAPAKKPSRPAAGGPKRAAKPLSFWRVGRAA